MFKQLKNHEDIYVINLNELANDLIKMRKKRKPIKRATLNKSQRKIKLSKYAKRAVAN